jgi:hypothetical protein
LERGPASVEQATAELVAWAAQGGAGQP